MKTTINKRFYNLDRVKRKGLHAEIEFGFDEAKILTPDQMSRLRGEQSADINFIGTISACGAPSDLPECDSYPKVQNPNDVIQVAVIEADEQTRIQLRVDLRSQDGIEVASEATNAETGLVLLESIDIDVAVVDGTLPDMNLVKFIRLARKVQAGSYVIPSKILVLVTSEQQSTLSEAVAAGVDAFCAKDAAIQKLAEAVRITHQQGSYQDPDLLPLVKPIVSVD